MIKSKLIIIFILFVYSGLPAYAHQDKIIELKNDKLVGLPDKYQPAYFDLKTKTLQVRNNKFKFPPCVAKYFPENEFKLFITSSWYHDLKNLPPYIVLVIQPENKDFYYELVFELDTLKPYHFIVYIKESEVITARHKIEIDKYCNESISKSLSNALVK